MYRGTAIFLLLLLPGLSPCQCPSFFMDGARWVYHTNESGEPGQQFTHSSDEQNIIHGDTIIESLVYHKLYTTFHNTRQIHLNYPVPHTIYEHSYDSIGPSFLRYDTLLKKVFYLPAVDSTERLIYDFTLEVGDSTPMQSEIFSQTVILSIDTVTVFGVPLRRFYIGDTIQTWIEHTNYILEGIGGSNGLTYFQPVYGFVSGGIYSTLLGCFQYQDSVHLAWAGECPFIDFISGTSDITAPHTVTVGPNPTRDEFFITISEELRNSTFTIVDFLGRVIETIKLSATHTTAHLGSPGIYFWQIMQDGRIIRAGKVVCE